jgi:hypothetical protein
LQTIAGAFRSRLAHSAGIMTDMELNPYQSPQLDFSRPAGRGAEATGFSVDCQCGATIAVNASQAGGAVAFPCGENVAVPPLFKIRTRVGLIAHETNIRDSIARMIEDQLLPWGQCCAVTEMPTDDVMWFDIQCEATYTKGGRIHPLLAIWGLLSPLGLLALAMRSREPTEIHGRDIVIRVPLLVQQDQQAGLRKSRQRRLKAVLSKVPVYEELFRDHPKAKISAP